MYAFVDRHPSALGNAGRFMLWALRGWTAAVAQKACPPMILRRAFDGMGASAALPDFHIATALLHRSTPTPLQVGSIACSRIGEDEAVLLAIWQAIARGDGATASGTLALLVPEEAVRPIARATASCTAQLLLAKLDLAETLPTPIEE